MTWNDSTTSCSLISGAKAYSSICRTRLCTPQHSISLHALDLNAFKLQCKLRFAALSWERSTLYINYIITICMNPMTFAAACCPLLSLQQAVSTCKLNWCSWAAKNSAHWPCQCVPDRTRPMFLSWSAMVATWMVRYRVLWLPRKVGVVRWRWCLESWNASHHLLRNMVCYGLFSALPTMTPPTLSGQRWAAKTMIIWRVLQKYVFLQPFSCISVESPPLLPPTQNKLTKQKNQHQLSIQTGFRSASRPQRQQLWWMAGSIWETPTCFR